MKALLLPWVRMMAQAMKAHVAVTTDRKSTRLNSSHGYISYAVFCLKKTNTLQQLNALATLVIIMVANKYVFLQITRRRFLNEWEAFKKVISRRNIRRRITIPLTLSNLKLLRRITRKENILLRNFFFLNVAPPTRISPFPGLSPFPI